MKKIVVLFLIAIMLMATVVGCTVDTSVENVARDDLVMAIGSEPDGGFDPCTGWGRYGNPLFQSTLIDTDKNMGIIYDLATEYSISEDGLTWTFKLREDAFFTDGEQVTAEDVVFTFETAKNSGSIVDLTNMESIKKLDDFTIEFKLHKPDLSFTYTVVATGIVPKHAYDPNYGENPIGSGPYTLAQWDKGQQIVMLANENYYGDIPEIKKVTILFLSEDAALAVAKAGQADVVAVTPDLANQSIPNMELKSLESIDNRGLVLPYVNEQGKNNMGFDVGNNVTSDIAIRRALSYGIDREAFVRDVLNGYGRPAFTECDGMPWGNEEAIVEYDTEKAKKILGDAGWIDSDDDGIRERGGLKAEFNLLYSASDSTRQALATATSLQAEELGIKINIEGTSWDVIDQRMYKDAVLMGWGTQNPIETYLLYHSDNMGKDYYNPENFSNDKVDEYIDMAMSSKDLDESYEYWKKVQWDGSAGVSTEGESPWVWLVNVDHLYYVREGLDIGEQKIHPHGHAWPLVANLKHWKWN
ncbi:MAG: ABC transporter substrate-binding protein [Tissierellaceae bacterium]|nr:ABC transporter substrate-binding protein [Tissierellaceae bacterium]